MKVGLLWHRGPYADMSWLQWLFSTAHDSSSWFWRICGLEVNIPRSDT